MVSDLIAKKSQNSQNHNIFDIFQKCPMMSPIDKRIDFEHKYIEKKIESKGNQMTINANSILIRWIV